MEILHTEAQWDGLNWDMTHKENSASLECARSYSPIVGLVQYTLNFLETLFFTKDTTASTSLSFVESKLLSQTMNVRARVKPARTHAHTQEELQSIEFKIRTLP